MLDIKPISTGINWAIIPKIIYKEFCKYGNERSFSSIRNETGEMITTYGELLPPYYTRFNHVENGFYCLEKHYDYLISDLKKGVYFDVDFNQLNRITILPFLNEYGKGFQYGYNNFENSFKDNSSLFSRRDEDIALRIFSRIFGFFSIKVGAFSFGISSDLEKAEEIKKEKSIKFIKIIKKKNFYESGISGGEFFKAWEIILNNPLIFKPIFEENIIEFNNTIEAPESKTHKSLINTEILEKSINIISYWLNEDKKVIAELLNIEFNIDTNIIKPFAKELNNNLHTKETQEGKRDLIKYYIFEFYGMLGFFKRNSDLIYNGKLKNIDDKSYIHISDDNVEKILDEYENYVVNSQIVFDLIFNEIQICCIKYSIDFFEICHVLNFSLEYFDSGISISNENTTNKSIIANDQISNKITTSKYSFKIKAGASKKRKAINLFEAFVNGKYVDVTSKKDFINAFTGYTPINKINWTGAFGDLKSFINHSISENLIEKVSKKWLYTANLFTVNGMQISNKQINDAKKTTGDINIKKIVILIFQL